MVCSTPPPRSPAPGPPPPHHRLDHEVVLLVAQRRAFSVVPTGTRPLRALGDLPLHQPLQRVEVQRAVAERVSRAREESPGTFRESFALMTDDRRLVARRRSPRRFSADCQVSDLFERPISVSCREFPRSRDTDMRPCDSRTFSARPCAACASSAALAGWRHCPAGPRPVAALREATREAAAGDWEAPSPPPRRGARWSRRSSTGARSATRAGSSGIRGLHARPTRLARLDDLAPAARPRSPTPPPPGGAGLLRRGAAPDRAGRPRPGPRPDRPRPRGRAAQMVETVWLETAPERDGRATLANAFPEWLRPSTTTGRRRCSGAGAPPTPSG
jgi:hypothetical protein